MNYHQAKDGEWIRPRMARYLMKCCDCGLVHAMEFRVTKAVNKTHMRIERSTLRVEFRATRLKKRKRR